MIALTSRTVRGPGCRYGRTGPRAKLARHPLPTRPSLGAFPPAVAYLLPFTGRPAHPAEPLIPPTDQLVPLAAAPASYALSLGLANGDLFGRVLAFSPGFVAAGPRHGGRRVFVSHGARDEVLPIDDTSRDVVPGLRRDGYVVEYREFDGGHVVPPDIARDAIGRVAGG